MGKAVGYKSNIVHTFNKNEFLITGTYYLNEIKKRRNVLLLGDNIGDLGMSEGIEYKEIIRVGFLNEDVKDSINEYTNAFDLVILNDGTMNAVNDIVKEILLL